jgi:ketosteroid isomerase-like protein
MVAARTAACSSRPSIASTMAGRPPSGLRRAGGAILVRLVLSRVELVRLIIDALNRGDVDGMLAHMDPDFEWRPLETSPVARSCRGHRQVRRYVEDWLGTFENLRLDLEEPTEIGDRVVSGVYGRARGRGSGVELDSRFCQVWTVRGGTAHAMTEYPTREKALAALRSADTSVGRRARRAPAG